MAKLSNRPAKLNFELEQRKSYAFRCNLKYADELPVNLTGCSLRFVMKPYGYDLDQNDTSSIIVNQTAVITEPTLGCGMFYFQASDLNAPAGEYDCSLTLWTSEGYSVPLAKGVVYLLENPEAASLGETYTSDIFSATLTVILNEKDVVNIVAENKMPPNGFMLTEDPLYPGLYIMSY